MQVDWAHHSSELVESLALFLKEGSLHDVTLCSSEGKKIKAHRVILAATSTYFKEILVSGDVDDPGKLPIIFLKDVPYCDLESLIQYIYNGKVVLAESQSLASFTQLARTMGISGFTDGSKEVTEKGVNTRYSETFMKSRKTQTLLGDANFGSGASQINSGNHMKSSSATSSISSTATTLIKRDGSNDLNTVLLTTRNPFSDILNKRNGENNVSNEFLLNSSEHSNNVSMLLSSNKSNRSNEIYLSSPHKQHTNSEPAIMPSQEEFSCGNEENCDVFATPTDQKRRRIQCHSLDDIDPRICTPPSPFKTPRGTKAKHKSPKSRLASAWPMSPGNSRTPPTPLSPLVLNSLWSNAPVLSNDPASVSPKSISFSHPPSYESSSHIGLDQAIANVSLPIRTGNINASRQRSCPVESKSPKLDVTNSSNFSLDSSSLSLLDPNDLAAKGATLLHHLAVWMIEENKSKDVSASANASLVDSTAEVVTISPATKKENQGPVYENLEELRRSHEEHSSFRAEINAEKDDVASRLDSLYAISDKTNEETRKMESINTFKVPFSLTTRSRQLSAPGGVMSNTAKLPISLANMSFGGGMGSRITLRQGSECTDRPDSGFDSKDEEEVRSSTSGGERSLLVGSFSSSHNTTQEGQDLPPLIRPSSRGQICQVRSNEPEPASEDRVTNNADEIVENISESHDGASEDTSSSPEVSNQISRQASTRQPVIRKRRFNAP